MIKYSDFLICKRRFWEKYIQESYEENAYVFKGEDFVFVAWNKYSDLKYSTTKHESLYVGVLLGLGEENYRSGHYLIVDLSHKHVRITSDAYETIPLYHDEDDLIFTTSLNALTNYKKIELVPNNQGILETLLLGYSVKPDTEYLGIKQVCRKITQLPNYIIYVKDILPETLSIYSRDRFIDYAIEKLRLVYSNIKSSIYPASVDFGLSGGLDSRLNLALILDSGLNFSPHTLSKGVANSDSSIAHAIGKKLKFTVREINVTYNTFGKNNLEYISTASAVNDFYDKRVLSLNSHLSQNYSYEGRVLIKGAHEWVLSGFGGEIFRNYRNLPSWNASFKMWFNYLMSFSSTLLIMDSLPEIFFSRLQEKLEQRIGVSMSIMNKEKHFLYYTKVFLSDAVGVKISTENRISNYLVPFLLPEVRSLSNSAVRFIGGDYSLQGDMIKKINVKLSQIPTNYGFAPSSIGFRNKLIFQLKSEAPFFVRKKIIERSLNYYPFLWKDIAKEKETFLWSCLINFYNSLDWNFDLYPLLKGTESGETLLSLALTFRNDQ